MSIVLLSDLVTPVTVDDALTNELTIAADLGLPTTAWQPIDPLRTFATTNATIVSQYSTIINLIAQGGYASYAAIIPGTGTAVDANGYDTNWMDLRALDQYNVTRIQAGYAATTVSLVSANASPYGPYAPGTLHFQSPLGGQPTYSNSSTVTVLANTTTTVAIVADAGFPGPSGNIPQGTVLVLVTTLVGVTVSPLGSAASATSQETNALLLKRCQNKLGSLSPNGPSQAYQYVVTSLPTPGSQLPDGSTWTGPTALNPYGVRTAIDRSQTVLNTGAGVVDVYVANASGAPEGCVQAAISSVTNASPPIVSTTPTHGLSDGDFAIIKGVVGSTGVNNSISGVVAWYVKVNNAHSVYLYEDAGLNVPAPAPGVYTSGGTLDGGDVGMCDAAVQAQVVPDGTTAIVAAATVATVPFACTVYIKANSSLSDSQAIANITDAVIAYFSTVPVGGIVGIEGGSTGVIPWSEVLIQIAAANPGTVSVGILLLNGVVADFVMSNGQVPVVGAATVIVNFV